ncbi:hypothetical protein ILUMI_14639, partial [Ignelater luminosus]
MPYTCCAIGCNSSTGNPDISLFRFPKDHESMQINRLKSTDIPTVFSAGSEAEMIQSKVEVHAEEDIDLNPLPLRDDFIEVEKNSSNIELDKLLYNSCVQTGKTLTHSTPRKLKLRSKIRTLQQKLLSVKSNNTREITEEDVTTFMEKNYLSIANFVKMQMHLTKVAPKGARHTTEFKQLALMIYFLGPK